MSGNRVVFDGYPDAGATDGLTSCYMADMGNNLTGGTVTWLGSGIFAARVSEIYIELTGGAVYSCRLASMAVQNVPVTLKNCQISS